MIRSVITFGIVFIAFLGAARAQQPALVAAASSTSDGTSEDAKALDDLQEAVGSFAAAQQSYSGAVNEVIKQQYELRRRELSEGYDVQIKRVEADEKVRRADAIARFEAFLAKYPSDKRWTPDALFRLAELYFERSNDEYIAAVDAAQTAPAGANAPIAPPTPDYTKTVDLYKRLISAFPDYRLIDGAYYLLGYCLGEMNEELQAKQAFLALVCGNKYRALDPPPAPKPSTGSEAAEPFVDPYSECVPVSEASRFVPEAWTRIGESHFDNSELELAVAAYSRVLKYKDSSYYDKALYKLAWSYFRLDRYPDAIKNFDALVSLSETEKKESGNEGSELEKEAIQYLGISFAEKDWNDDQADDFPSPNPSDPVAVQEQRAHVQALTRIEDFYRGRDGDTYVPTVYKKLGDIYYDETEYLQAIQVYRRLLEKWPYEPDNPKVQDRIVKAYKLRRDFDHALVETEKLANDYSRGSEWRKHNAGNTEALAAADDIREQSLASTAVEHHKAAQALKKLALASHPPDGAKLEQALREYAQAANGYADYLQSFPNSKNTYDYTFFYAEALYYSRQFNMAAQQYEKVRDSNLDNRYLEDAAFDTVKSLESLLDEETRAGKLTLPALPDANKLQAPVRAIPMPPEVRRLQGAYDAFVERVPASGRVPVMAYKAAEIDFRYLDFDKARPRMEGVLEKYCKENDVAQQAGAAILATYTIEKNLDKIIEWGEKLSSKQCGTPGKVATAGAGGEKDGLAKTINDAKFLKAQQAFDAGKFEEAAGEFVKLVDGDPQNKSGNNDKALNNAAVAYEKVSRFAAATRLYERIVNEYPKSQFVDDALFRTAVNYQRFFEFDKAVVSYQRLATDSRFQGSTHRTDALYNAAVLLDNDQQYADAAKLFQQYSNEAGVKLEDRADAYFRSGLIYLKDKNPKKVVQTFNDYLKNYGSTDPKKAIEAKFHIAEAYELEGNHAAAMMQYKKVAADGATVPPASDAAEYPAHAAFLLAEVDLAKLEKMKISGGGKVLQRSVKKFQDAIVALDTAYESVLTYRRATWALAAYFRQAYIRELFSRALLGAPCPPEVKKLGEDACDVYTQQIEQLVSGVDDQALKRYRATLEQAARLGVSNDWTRLARQKANAYNPTEFPLVKDEKIEMQLEDPK